MSVNIPDFLRLTREKRKLGRDKLLNEASLHTYFCLSKLFMGSKDRFKGGAKIVDFVQANTNGNARFYNPLGSFSPSTREKTVKITVPWSFMVSDYTLVNEAVSLNGGDEDAFVDLVMAEEQACLVDNLNKLEQSLWALPNADTMETAVTGEENAQEPYSLLCFVTRDGLVPSSGNGGIATGSSAWTTLQTVNPTTQTWFRNQTDTYTAASFTDGTAGIVPAFDRMIQSVGFEMPGPLSRYAENTAAQKQVIATNADGVPMYQQALRALNDRMAQLNDPTISGPQYNGVPLKYVSELDNAGWTADQPDYLWLNFNVINPWVHTENYLREQVEEGGVTHPNKTVVYKFTWANILLRSRRRLGRINAA